MIAMDVDDGGMGEEWGILLFNLYMIPHLQLIPTHDLLDILDVHHLIGEGTRGKRTRMEEEEGGGGRGGGGGGGGGGKVRTIMMASVVVRVITSG